MIDMEDFVLIKGYKYKITHIDHKFNGLIYIEGEPGRFCMYYEEFTYRIITKDIQVVRLMEPTRWLRKLNII